MTYPCVKFGDVVHLNTDRVSDPLAAGIERYVGLEHITPEDLHIHTWGRVAEGTTFTNYFKPGQVLFGKRRAYQRKVAVADFAGVCSSDIYVFESKDPEVLLPDLLPFICQTEGFYQHAVGTSAGSLSPRTNWTQLANYEFPLPPLAEQRRIASLLWAVEEVIASNREMLSGLRGLWVSMTAYYFGESNGRKEHCLEDLLDYGSDGPFGSKLKTAHYSTSGVRVIRLQNIQENYFNDTDRAFISYDYYQRDLKRYTVYPGDVLVAGLGDNNIRAGRACVTPDNIGLAINKADCYCLRPKPELTTGYLVAFLNSVYGLRQSESFAQGTTRFRLNLGNIKRMRISIPDKTTQQEIVAKLQVIENTVLHQEENIEKTVVFKKTLVNYLL